MFEEDDVIELYYGDEVYYVRGKRYYRYPRDDDTIEELDMDSPASTLRVVALSAPEKELLLLLNRVRLFISKLCDFI